MKKVLKKIYLFYDLCIREIISIISVLVLSRIGVGKKMRKSSIKNHDVCVVLGNGPSLANELSSLLKAKDSVDFIAVNAFCKSEFFTLLKPANYVLLDGQFFVPRDERSANLSQDVMSGLRSVNWPMNLILPINYKKKHFEDKIANSNIKTVYINDITVDGSRGFRNLFYDKQWGTPKCQTVLIGAIYIPIYLRYKEVYVYGADHSWTKDLRVDDNNVLCYGDRHVYDTKLTEIKMKYGIADLLLYYSNMFTSHNLLRDYSDYAKVPVYNATDGSFIDAYERKKLNVLQID